MKKFKLRWNHFLLIISYLVFASCDQNDVEFQSTREKFPELTQQYNEIAEQKINEMPKEEYKEETAIVDDIPVVDHHQIQGDAQDASLEEAEDATIELKVASIQFVMKEDSILSESLISAGTFENAAFEIVETPVAGILTLLEGGKFKYQPHQDFFGNDLFTFRVKDSGMEGLAKVSIDILPINDPPSGKGESFVLSEDESLEITLRGQDIDDSSLSFILVDQPSHGKIDLENFDHNKGILTYKPHKNYFGSDMLSYQLKDPHNRLSEIYDIEIIVNPVNDAPVLMKTAFTFFKNIQGQGQLIATDVDDKKLQFSLVAGKGPSKGEISLHKDTGGFTFVSTTDGIDSFFFQVTDSLGASAVAEAVVTITDDQNAILIENQTIIVEEDQSMTGQIKFSSSISDQNPKIILIQGPTLGKLSFNQDELTFSFIPNGDSVGQDFFKIQLEVDGIKSEIAIIGIDILGKNDAPETGSLNLKTNENTIVSGQIPGKDRDGDPLTFQVIESPKNGKIHSFATTTGSFTYMPNLDYSGTDTFKVSVSDGILKVDSQVTIVIEKINEAPIAEDSTYVVATHEMISQAQLKAIDPDEDSLTFHIVDQPKLGNLIFFDNKKGLFSYEFKKEVEGQSVDQFTFYVTDGKLISHTKTVTIKNQIENAVPVVQPLKFTAEVGEVVSAQIEAKDPNGDVLDYGIVNQPSNGIIVSFDRVTGQLSYVSNPGFVGTDTFTFSVSDGFATAVGSMATITVKDSILELCTKSNRIKAKLDIKFSSKNACDSHDDDNPNRHLSNKTSLRIKSSSKGEMTHDLMLPDHGILCQLKLKSSEHWKMKGDSAILFNQHVLAASNSKLVINLGKKDDLPVWNWDRVKGEIQEKMPLFCLEGPCQIPGMNESGPVEIDIDPATITRMSQKVSGTNHFKLKLVSMSHEDLNECGDSKYKFKLKAHYEYVIPN